MSYENQELTEHQFSHAKYVKGCEYCQVEREIKTKVEAWDIIQKAMADM